MTVIPAELMAELIDEEHRLLLHKLADVEAVCPELDVQGDCTACTVGEPEACIDRVTDVLLDLLAYFVEHFRYEESLMKQFGLDAVAKESCDRHREDHGQIAEGFARIIADLNPTTVRPQISNLIALLRRWLDNHISSHDLRLKELLAGG